MFTNFIMILYVSKPTFWGIYFAFHSTQDLVLNLFRYLHLLIQRKRCVEFSNTSIIFTPVSQNKGTQKVDSSNRCHAMIHHQNADAMVLASARLRGIPPWMSAILNIIRGVNASQTCTVRTMASAF